MNKNKQGRCVYCGAVGQVTDDHIPPLNLFPTPRPSNLVTVKACHPCHKATTMDDEYFRNTISLREDVFDHPAVTAILPRIWRSLERSEAPGLRKTFVEALSIRDVYSNGGIYLGRRPAYNVDLIRLNRVAARIVKGLFSILSEHRLPSDYDSRAYEVSGFSKVPPDVAESFRKTCDTVLSRPPALVLGDNIFKCWWATTDIDKNSSIWILAFLTKIFFIAWTGPSEKLQ